MSRRVWQGLASLGLIGIALTFLPAAAAAQAQVFGSPLTAPPNFDIGCETGPVLDVGSGNYFLTPSGQPDCTWRQQGVFGAPAGDTRFSSVPGDGRIIGAEVKAGGTPAPLKFVVLSQLVSQSDPDNTSCCHFVSETAGTFQPQPNTTTPFPLDIPVQRNTVGDLRRFDLVGISAASNTGGLPLHSNGNNNAGFYTTFGSVNAGYFYPRVSAADGQNARYEFAIPGIELLVRWTWCPAGQTCAASGGGGGGGGGGTGGGGGGTGGGGGGGIAAPAPTVGPGAAQARNGRALVDLICGADAACAGALELFNRGGAARSTRKTISYGTATYQIPAGGEATIKVKLSGKAKKIIKKKDKLKADLTVNPAGGTAVTYPLMIKD